MRVLFLGINYWPEETGIAVFNTGRCEYLAARGHNVVMVTGFPYYPQWQVPEAYRGRLFASERRAGVDIRRSYLYAPRNVTPVRRMLHEASFVASSCVRALSGRRPDILLTVSPPLALGLSSILLSRLWRIPYVLHVPDLQPDAAADLGMLRSGRLLTTLYAVERLSYRCSALVTTLTEAMRRRILAKGIPAAKVRLFSDWADPLLFTIPLRGGGASFRRTFDLEGRFLVLHAGNMGVKQGLGVVLDAAEHSAGDPGIVHLLVGDGAVRPALERAVASKRLQNVRFLPLQPNAVFHDMLAAADICLVTQQRTVADIVFPSKVLTLLAAGRPLIASVNATSEVARVMEESGAGLVVPPEDGPALHGGIAALRADRTRREHMGAAGRCYAGERWDRHGLLKAMEAQLAAVAAVRQPEDRRAPHREQFEIGTELDHG
ncbi:MAG TPA: WcaI family glycosyltransferase [Candidatus Binatia bacterium]|nr:WcaI family glycosyltransferase [Candidatus Binatia bacterium]